MSLLSGRHRIMGSRRKGTLVMTVLEEGMKIVSTHAAESPAGWRVVQRQ